VLIRGRNCRKYIGKCLRSLARQSVDWRAVLILDAPSDGVDEAVPEILKTLDIEDRVIVHVRKTHRGLCHNMYAGLLLCKAEDEDVICVLDADDWLSKDALTVVDRMYRKTGCWLTYGSYKKLSKGRRTKISSAYPRLARIRKYPWRASHLKTFKWKLAKNLNKGHFQHEGKWLRAASDVALMFPLLELAGLKRCKHIHKVIYEWRDNTPTKTKRRIQKSCEKIIRQKRHEKRLS